MTDLMVTERDGVVYATLNRPEIRNALSDAMMRDFIGLTIDIATRRGTLRALVIRGADGVFCAGGDIKSFRSVFQDGLRDAAQIAAANRVYGTLLTAVRDLPVPVVAAVEGAAMGGGVGLLSVADIVIATGGTKISTTETTLGLPPAQIAAFVVDRIGAPAARRLMLTAARIDADEAHRIGLVDQVVANSSELDSAVLAVLGQIRRCAPGANAMTKELVNTVATTPRNEFLDNAAQRFGAAMLGPEAADGVGAFISRGTPSWVVSA